MGSGSTVAAAESLGVLCVGVERHREYFEMSMKAIPKLATIVVPSDQRLLAF
jgi:site-specific DNA-methyltransferase (adenine-specific)